MRDERKKIITDGTTDLSITVGGAAKTDGSATTQPISAATLPLPTGAATETTLSTRLADATFTTRINTLGQKTMANSTPIVISSDQSTVHVGVFNTVSNNQLYIESLGNVFTSSDSRLFTINNKTYTNAFELNAATSGTDNPVILIRNPNGSGKIAYFYLVSAGVQINNVFSTYKIFANPTITANGTTQTPASLNVGGGAAAATILINTLPTISANGTALVAKMMSQNGTPVDMTQDGIIGLNPNNSLLITANPQSNNRVSAFTLHWAEI